MDITLVTLGALAAVILSGYDIIQSQGRASATTWGLFLLALSLVLVALGVGW